MPSTFPWASGLKTSNARPRGISGTIGASGVAACRRWSSTRKAYDFKAGDQASVWSSRRPKDLRNRLIDSSCNSAMTDNETRAGQRNFEDHEPRRNSVRHSIVGTPAVIRRRRHRSGETCRSSRSHLTGSLKTVSKFDAFGTPCPVPSSKSGDGDRPFQPLQAVEKAFLKRLSKQSDADRAFHSSISSNSPDFAEISRV